MKLIFMYGPPASGKLTIAEILSERLATPLFHNHLSRDLAKDIYGDKLKDNYDLVDTIRFNVFEYCAKHDTDLIFTYVYEGKDDDANIRRFVEIIESNAGEVIFIELTASKQDLMERVNNESRLRYKKLTDPAKMASIVEDMSKFTIPYVDAFRVDTSRLSAQESADVIQCHLTGER